MVCCDQIVYSVLVGESCILARSLPIVMKLCSHWRAYNCVRPLQLIGEQAHMNTDNLGVQLRRAV
jgi:hypothetical protein